MAVVNGMGGSITTTGSNIVANVKEWSITFEAAEIDVTSMASTSDWNEFIPGRKNWSGTYSIVWDSTADVLPDGSTGIGQAAASGSFLFDSVGKVVGTVIITGVDTSVAMDDANTIAYTFRGSGVPVWTVQS